MQKYCWNFQLQFLLVPKRMISKTVSPLFACLSLLLRHRSIWGVQLVASIDETIGLVWSGEGTLFPWYCFTCRKHYYQTCKTSCIPRWQISLHCNSKCVKASLKSTYMVPESQKRLWKFPHVLYYSDWKFNQASYHSQASTHLLLQYSKICHLGIQLVLQAW